MYCKLTDPYSNQDSVMHFALLACALDGSATEVTLPADKLIKQNKPHVHCKNYYFYSCTLMVGEEITISPFHVIFLFLKKNKKNKDVYH